MYSLLLLCKFVSVLGYAGGIAATLASDTAEARRIAAHRIASSALLGIWVFGYLLTLEIGVPLTEAWIVGGFLFSFLTQGAVEFTASSGKRGPGMLVLIGLPLLLALGMMVYRPTWSALSP